MAKLDIVYAVFAPHRGWHKAPKDVMVQRSKWQSAKVPNADVPSSQVTSLSKLKVPAFQVSSCKVPNTDAPR